LKKAEEAAAELMVRMLFPTEPDEKTEAHRLTDVYEVRGLLSNESILHQTAWGASYEPHLVLDVEEIRKVLPGAEPKSSPATGKKKYLKLTCRQVSNGIHGIYEMDESLRKAVDQKVEIQGTIYPCGDNWYICDKDKTEIYCDSYGKVYDSSHVELIHLKMNAIDRQE